MNMNKKLTYALSFCRFCEDARIRPQTAAMFVTLARRVFVAATKHTGFGTEETESRAEQARTEFDDYARNHSFEPDFSNPYPAIVRDCQTIRIPPTN